ncbi:MAG: hypothetical protein K9J37_02095 [Saprospiraceae bacterium]|nr:hypothetical protein [Saprospiraceae bacterium]MCF8248670.1 hypothetical protein [Saprospiraceae bacterium]MCF8278840.1 hypothetical protein [Bacteroidales bacterium]MCF8310640.1 hypothetical protein [Saprospiraceae bacterium]MCF8439199.1 hypothetical protein [Saprospiraceae bacterium]
MLTVSSKRYLPTPYQDAVPMERKPLLLLESYKNFAPMERLSGGLWVSVRR